MSKPFTKELNELVAGGVIPQNIADDITAYYATKSNSSSNRFPIVVNVLGALLVSLGIILLVAHNWDDLSRFSKTIFAFIPLLVGQGMCAYTLIKKKNSAAWRECSAVVLFFAIATSISLVSQTYHISGTMSGFLLTWMLLAAPVIYLMPSSVVALLYIGGITWYACELGYFTYSGRQMPFYYLLLLAVLIPHYWRYFRRNPNSNFFHLTNWALVLSLTISLGAFNSDAYDRSPSIFAAYLAMFCVFYLLGRSVQFDRNRLFLNPFLFTGALGILIILFSWSFDWLWTDAGIIYNKQVYQFDLFRAPLFYVGIGLLALAGWLMLSDYRRIKKVIFDPVGFSGFLFLILLLLSRNATDAAVFIVNGWLLFVAVFFIRRGALLDHLGILNFGLLIIAILALCRFFDDEIPFVWRGLFFLVTGAGFFAANYWLVKKRKALQTQNNS